MPAPSKRKDIFNNAEMTEIAKEWKIMDAAGKRDEAMPLLEKLIIGCQEMLPRLAQHEGFHRTVDVDTLVAAASAKIESWLRSWNPEYKSTNGLFSWLGACSKNAFRSELAKTNQYRRYFHASGENLEKFYGETDYHKYKDEAAAEVRENLKDLAVRWGDPQEIGAVRFIVESIIEENPDSKDESATVVRERIIRSCCYAWAVSPDLGKFFYSWAVYALRDSLFKKSYIPFTEEDIIRHSESYTLLPDLLDIIGWDKFKQVIRLLGGNRLKLPTLQQLGKLHENYQLAKEIEAEGDDPISVERVAKRRGRSYKTAQEVFQETSEIMDQRRCGEHYLFSEDHD